MSFFKKISKALFPSQQDTQRMQVINVRCQRCKEELSTRVNLKHDLSLLDEGGYISRKTIIGQNRCFQRIELTLYFNARRELVDKHITGGSFIEPEPEEQDNNEECPSHQ